MSKKSAAYAFAIVVIVALLLSPLTIKVSYAQAGMDPLGVPHYFGPYPNYATSQLPVVTYYPNGSIASVTGGIMKFVDSLPGLGPTGANNLGQYMPIAVADNTTYPGCDYYEIALVQYREKMHSNLTATDLRGYVQLSTSVVPGSQVPLTYPNGSAILVNGVQAKAVDNPHYLGPLIIASRDRPVRVKFTNLLPTGAGGDLFIPVDTSVMGSGDGPNQIGVDGMGMPIYEQYKQNRATLHLHGGNTPWISDGTAHQWTTPAGENTSYPKGVSVAYVPDMWFINGNVIPNTVGQTTPPVAGATNNPGAGSLTFYYTNQQSARLMFYHDHSFGITRLNVYAGEAAGYLLTDEVEQSLITSGLLPGVGTPLIIQDKTFVPDITTPITNMWGTFASQLAFQDPTWSVTKYGGPGSLWYPHVYMEMQNPGDPTGWNPFGRWQYSPWWWPPFMPMHGPVPNPYYTGPGNPMEPYWIPGTPNPSMPGEAFMDTPLVNGAAYPYLVVQPMAYRFRILNAADDRMWNLQWYVADNTIVTADGRINTEVKMVPALYNSTGLPNSTWPETWPTDNRAGGVPDPTTRGPAWIQIGTEGGFLPAPVVIPNQAIDWNNDKGTFDFGVVNTHSLLLGTAERADVIVDFSNFAGKTLILYNDAPAAFPTADPRLDYYTGDLDQTDGGGAPSTVPGYGPNTRTIMQVQVSGSGGSAPVDDYNPATLAALEAAFASTATTQGVFQRDQNTIIVPQAAYSSAYNTTFPDVWSNIFDNSLTFTPVNASVPVTIPFQAKSMHDEMGGTFDEMYGRMKTSLGVEIPKSTPQTATTILYGFADPPTEVLKGMTYGTLIGTLSDGTQIWKITHNGVDTHTIHWHMFEVQLINRVAWDNNVRWPDANELGWKDTLRINPLQDTIVAMRPIVPNLPFDLPNNVRPLDPTKPLGVTLRDANAGVMDPTGEPITIVNHLVNYGYEFTWHCHILAHEEMDMMRAVAVAFPPRAPSDLIATVKGSTATLVWKDNSLSETSFTIQRADDANFTIGLATFTVGADVTIYTDTTIMPNKTYYYRVTANNLVGDTFVYAAPAVGFPHISVDSAPSNTATPTTLYDAYLVVRGTNNAPYWRAYNQTTNSWNDWTALPGATEDSPAAALMGNELHTVIRGMDGGSILHGYVNLTDNTFSGWTLLSGSTPSAPTLTSNGTALSLVVRGQDNLIYYRFYTFATRMWTDWTALPLGSTIDSPAATVLANKLHTAVRGMDGSSIWHSSVDLSTAVFSGWDLVGGATQSKPTLATCESRNEIVLVVRGLNDVIYRNTWNGIGWAGWSGLPTGATPDGVGATVIGQTLHVIVRGMDGSSIWHSSVDLSTEVFSGWDLVGGATQSKPTIAG